MRSAAARLVPNLQRQKGEEEVRLSGTGGRWMNWVAQGLQDETKGEPDPAVRERGQERDHDCRKSISSSSVFILAGCLFLSDRRALTITQPVEGGGQTRLFGPGTQWEDLAARERMKQDTVRACFQARCTFPSENVRLTLRPTLRVPRYWRTKR